MVNEIFILAVIAAFWITAKQVKIPTRRHETFIIQLGELAHACQTTAKAIQGLGHALKNFSYAPERK